MRDLSGHIYCIFTILIWGLTFVSTKVLLSSLSPFDVLLCRTLIAFFSLTLLTRTLPRFFDRRYTLLCLLAALFGNNLYFIFENNALSYSFASNVSVIVSTAPLFTALLNQLFGQHGQLSASFFIGFALAMLGTVLLWWHSLELKLNVAGDLLALLAALSWALYTLTIRRLVTLGYATLQITLTTFACSLLLLLLMLPLYGVSIEAGTLLDPLVCSNLLFLGVLASALGFLLWNRAVRLIGPVKTSIYIYAQPVVTTVAASVLIYERPTVYTVAGIILIIGGLMVSEQYNLRAVLQRRGD